MFFDYSLLATNIVLGVDGVEVSFSLYWFRVLEDHFVYNILTDSKQEKEKEKKKRKEKEGVELVKLDAVLSDFLETRKLNI